MRGRVVLLLVVLVGCTRSYYRTSADRETYPAIAERIVSPAYDIGRTQVEPPPTSRLHDPFPPDHPPKPPDDPAAAVFMDRPGGLRGASNWEKDGVAPFIESPGWEQSLGLDASGTLKLDPDRAVELALLHSREYQTALEGVYLQALALTLNRFEFDVRWFGRTSPTYAHAGYSSLPAETNTLEIPTNLGFNRTLATGGQLIVDFANSLTYEFTSGTHTVRSNVVASLVQPLLRNGGRRIRLEALTQAERDLLYSVRDFARFRKQFWAGIAVGAGGGGTTGPRLGGGGSYLDLLLALQTLRNNQANLRRQEETYRLYYELFRGGRASVVELNQFFQSFQSARLAVIDAEIALQNALDAFKLQLGLPPRLPVVLDDALLDQFVLTDPAAEALREELEIFQRERLRELDQPPPPEQLRTHFTRLREIAERIPAMLQQATEDLGRWGQRLDRPLRAGDDPEQRERDRESYEALRKEVPEITAELRKVTQAIEQHRAAVAEGTRGASWEALTQDIKIVLAQLDAVLAMQTQARIYLIELPDVEVQETEALAYARENRLDLQNQQARVTDAWRQVSIAANALRAELDIVATANVVTEPGRNNPVGFTADASRYSVGLQFDSPLNRQAERNAYRASLITYQRARRGYMEMADRIELSIRQDLRGLTRLRASFEIARQRLLSAARQYENARLDLFRPGKRTGNDVTTLNLLRALDDLLTARNALAASYINYEQQRVQLLLDLEALQLDPRGFPTHVPSRTPDGPQPPAREPERLPAPRPVAPPAAPPAAQ